MPKEPISKELLLKFFDLAPVGIFVQDPRGRVIYANSAAREIWGGIKYADISGYGDYKGWWPSTGKRIEAEEWATARAVRKGEVTIREEIEIENFRGERKFILNSAFPLAENGIVTWVITVNEDITAQREAEKESQHHRRLLETVFSSLDVLIAYMDRDFNFLKVNRAYAEAGKRHPDFFPGKNHFQLYPNKENEAIFRKVVETGEQHYEYWKPFIYPEHPERGVTWWNWSIHPVKVPDGSVTGVVLSLVDVTELKRKEDALMQKEIALREARENALREANEKLDIILRYAPEGIVISDERARVLTVNPAAERVYARPVPMGEDFESHGRLQLCHPDGSPYDTRDLPLTRSALDGEYCIGVDMLIRWPDGQERSLLVNTAPLKNEQEEVIGAIGMFQDITDKKKAEQEVMSLSKELQSKVSQLEERTRELNMAMEELVRANKEVEFFAYSLAHDLRSPLRLIDGFSMVLLKKEADKLSVAGRDQLERIRAATNRMNTLIDDLMNLSFVMRAEIIMQELDLSGMATSVIEDLRKAEPERTVGLRAQGGLKARGDAKLVRLAFENLIGNAWKYTSKVQTPFIEFGSLRDENGRTVFFVRDNGIGFDNKFAETVFMPFQRLHSADEYPGTGVGLATVKRIVERHGGHIWAEAQEGKGATFLFTLQ